MKNIIIAGSARSGKTTLAALLKERFPVYSVFHGDCIREWLIALYGKEHASELVHSDNYPFAMLQLLDAILKNSTQPYIVEWSRFYPSIISNLASYDNCTFLYLGHGGITPEVLFQHCRKYECEMDFTASLSDSDLLKSCMRWAKVDARIMNECISENKPYYDTSKNRLKVLMHIVSDFTTKEHQG